MLSSTGKSSRSSTAPSLTSRLRTSLKGCRKLAVLGIGSEFRADDAAGSLVASLVSIQAERSKALRAMVHTFDGATAPENLTGEIRAYGPTHIVIVDCAEIPGRAGTIKLFITSAIRDTVSFSTHKLPAQILIDYLERSLGALVFVIGIRPKSIKFGKPMSSEVKKACRDVARAITSALS